ncbi:MazG-like family protein [Streptococcus dysgalactiae subsp. equisimilis]|uniref:MazG-like family protein n=1 Tax=Streptococcus dysgalactiae TaxID=1334 RepID=UPI003FD8858F
MTFEELQKRIELWAVNKALDKADPKIQWMRVTEEVGEIRDVLLKPTKFEHPELALVDAIGDSLVTLIVLSRQLNIDPVKSLEVAYNEIKNRKGKMINGTFVKEEDLK